MSCPSSPLLLKIFMNRISWYCQEEDGVRFRGLRILWLLFADDIVLVFSSKQWNPANNVMVWGWLWSSGNEDQHLCLPKAIDLRHKTVNCSPQLGKELMPPSSSISGSCSWMKGKWSWRLRDGLGWWCRCYTSLLWWSKFSIYWSIYILSLTYSHKLWVVTERTISQIQVNQ